MTRIPPDLHPTTLVNDLTLNDLHAIAQGTSDKSLSDFDFLETLAAHHCLLVPPWLLRTHPDGTLERLLLLPYDDQGNLLKPQILLTLLSPNTPTPHHPPRWRTR